MPHKEPDVLILKLEEHLNHIIAIPDGCTFQRLLPSERLGLIYDEVTLMLALIQGAKEL